MFKCKLKKISASIILYYLFIFIYSPSFSMNIEENSDYRYNSKNPIFQLEASQQKIGIEEDQAKLEIYATTLLPYNIKVEKTFSPDEKKVNLTLRPVAGLVLLLGENYVPAFDKLPSLQTLSISLDFSHKELNLEELRGTLNVARNNTSFVHLISKNLGYWNPDRENEHTQHLLRALLFRNSFIQEAVKDFSYSFCLTDNPEVENAIAEGLYNAVSLKNLNISFNEELGKRIIDSLKNNQSITSVGFSFYWRSLDSDEANSLMYFVAHSPSLDSLRLEASLDDPLLCKFAEVLKQASMSLKKLKMGSTVGKQKARPLSEESVGSFFQALGVNKSLKSLQLDFPPFLPSIQILAEALKLNKTLKILALPNQDLGDEGITFLVEGLKENHSVTEIDCSNNNISDIGANAILNMLAINQNLTTLYLAGNSINSSKKAEINKILDKRKVPVFNFSREISLQ